MIYHPIVIMLSGFDNAIHYHNMDTNTMSLNDSNRRRRRRHYRDTATNQSIDDHQYNNREYDDYADIDKTSKRRASLSSSSQSLPSCLSSLFAISSSSASEDASSPPSGSSSSPSTTTTSLPKETDSRDLKSNDILEQANMGRNISLFTSTCLCSYGMCGWYDLWLLTKSCRWSQDRARTRIKTAYQSYKY
jgi:hypothetical protein